MTDLIAYKQHEQKAISSGNCLIENPRE